MVGFTHLGFGLLLGTAFHSKYAFILSGIGSLLPDIDANNSIINKLIHSSKKNSNNRNRYNNKNNRNSNNYLKHRGIMHSLTMPLLIYLVYFALMGNNLILPFIVGYASHLLLDVLTPMGVPLIMPITNKHFRIASGIKTASLEDYALGIVFYLIFFVFEFL